MPRSGRTLKKRNTHGEHVRLDGHAVVPGRATGHLRFGSEGAAPLDIPPWSVVAVRTLAEFAAEVGSSRPPPVAWVIKEDLRGALGFSLPPLPTVSGVDFELLREGDRVDVDGTAGALELPGVTEVPVVTAFLERRDGRILLMRRSDKVGSFQGRWAAVSGYVEQRPAREQAVREVGEETGIHETDLRLEREGAPLRTRQDDRVYTVHGFRFRVEDPEVRLDWEHTEFEWVHPVEISRRPTVPKLGEVWALLT
ncbi:MAG: NUDIX domain-containing protein [Candidatus Lutacidiplasmatales archaeon]